MTDGFEAAGVMEGRAAARGVTGGPLAGALGALGAELAQRAQALAEAVTATSGGVTTAAANYETSDAAASRRIEGTVPGG